MDRKRTKKRGKGKAVTTPVRYIKRLKHSDSCSSTGICFNSSITFMSGAVSTSIAVLLQAMSDSENSSKCLCWCWV